MILELLILLFLLWIWSGGFTPDFLQQVNPVLELGSSGRSMISEQEVLQRLSNDLNNLFEDRSTIPSYELLPSKDRTFVTNKRTIYLVLRRPGYDDFFDYATILHAAIHEMAHILCPEKGHSDNFYQIEDYLMQQAYKQHLLHESFYPDPDYPCQDE